jgi:type I restriction enzyme, R subunit
VFRQFPRDFFDLIIVDECHRGSARATSSWREILSYFESAVQLGLTATPKRDDNADSYEYFGEPLYQYSLRQGIEDGFLAPYRVHRVVSEWDATGWRPTQGMLDRYGREVPDEEYQTSDFEKSVALRARTEAIARHLTEFMAKTDPMAKTIVFCVDQPHALEMATAIGNCNAELRRRYPNYVCRVTADEGEIGRGHLGRFQELEAKDDSPVILTSSQMLTTGVDAQMIKNVVLARVVGSMSEFKQIIGRGTRVRDEYGKLWFNIIDYTGTATAKFADPAFDGDPVREDVTDINDPVVEPEPPAPVEPLQPGDTDGEGEVLDPDDALPRKLYVDGGHVRIVHHQVQDIDPDGHVLRTTRYEDYAAGRVRILCPTVFDLKAKWADPIQRSEIIAALAAEGVEFDALAEALQQPDADPFDLLCHLAFNAPLRTRRERARLLKSQRKDFFEQHGPKARQILGDLLDKYAEHGDAQFMLPEVLHVAPLSNYGTISEIAREFGGPEKLRAAVTELQNLLYQETT